MQIIEWAPITETEKIPPLGKELKKHLANKKNTVKQTSCSAWNLLFQILHEAGIPKLTVAFTDTGKPYFRDSDIYLSLSHSKGICAVTGREK